MKTVGSSCCCRKEKVGRSGQESPGPPRNCALMVSQLDVEEPKGGEEEEEEERERRSEDESVSLWRAGWLAGCVLRELHTNQLHHLCIRVVTVLNYRNKSFDLCKRVNRVTRIN